MSDVNFVEFDEPIFIIGVPRSGTSVTTGIIHHSGAFGGEDQGANIWNETGYYENWETKGAILAPYFDSIGASPGGWFPFVNEDVYSLPAIPDLKNRIHRLFLRHGYKGGAWYFKGVKISHVWKQFNDIFPKAKWVIVRRDNEEIIDSCFRTDFMQGFKTKGGWQTWINRHQDRFKEILDNCDAMEIWPKEFIDGCKTPNGDISSVCGLIDWLGLKWDEDFVREFVNPKVWGKDKRYQSRQNRVNERKANKPNA